ncbi:hypothetical protein SLA2020_160890 [Shorea laevis]
MQWQARLKAIDHFQANENGILVATYVAARGLDIPGVQTVVHYELPHSADVYVHRSGRTARTSADGCSIALISPNDSSKFASLCRSFLKLLFFGRKFPLESSYMPEGTRCLSLAHQIDKIMRKESQEKAKKSWLQWSAESLELDVENYENVARGAQFVAFTSTGPLQPKTVSHHYPAAAGVIRLIQHQFEELAKRKISDNSDSGANKRIKLVVIGQDCKEPLQALRNAGHEVAMDVKQIAEKRRKVENLRRKRKEEKKRNAHS